MCSLNRAPEISQGRGRVGGLAFTRDSFSSRPLCENQYYDSQTSPLCGHPTRPLHRPHYCGIQCFPLTLPYCNTCHTIFGLNRFEMKQYLVKAIYIYIYISGGGGVVVVVAHFGGGASVAGLTRGLAGRCLKPSRSHLLFLRRARRCIQLIPP